jgi:hypothetical protein
MQRIFGSAALLLVLATTIGFAGDAAVAGRASPCPRGLHLLQTNSIGPASTAALRRESRRSKPFVTTASLATTDTGRGGEAKSECGSRAWRRTVVVYITLRAMLPSASLSERVDFVGRFSSGYRVWQVVH